MPMPPHGFSNMSTTDDPLVETRSSQEKEAPDVTDAIQASSTTPSFPEGGTKAWLVAGGHTMTMFTTWGYLYAFGYEPSASLAYPLSAYMWKVSTRRTTRRISFERIPRPTSPGLVPCSSSSCVLVCCLVGRSSTASGGQSYFCQLHWSLCSLS